MATELASEQYQKFQARPQLLEMGKISKTLVRNGKCDLNVQVIAEGGEDTLHKHPNSDAIWYVLQGEATFYGPGDKLIATVGKNEGLFVEHDAPYWFGSSSQENLVILRFGSRVSTESPDKKTELAERNRGKGVTGPDGVMVQENTTLVAGKFFGG